MFRYLFSLVMFFSVHCAMAQIAYDDAADSAYDTGWSDGSNGGFGFSPWSFYDELPDPHFLISDSTSGGLHGGINTNGRAFSMTYIPFGGISAGRYFNSDVIAGQRFSIDILHQDPLNMSVSRLEVYTPYYDGFTVAIDNGQVMVAFFGVESFIYDLPTESGIHVDVDPLASGQLKVGVQSLFNGESRSVISTWNTYGSLRQFNVNCNGTGTPDQTFVNRMQVTPVPEPSSFAILGLGYVALRHRRRCHTKSRKIDDL